MVKNGRPYTPAYEGGWNNGNVDDALITDKPQDIIDAVFDWIEKNIPKMKALTKRTSYGLKHDLQHDTKIYLTNNEFKDAMMLCGYKPFKSDINKMNWRFHRK